MTSTALCVVATEGLYQDFAHELFLTAEKWFQPTPVVEFVLEDGEPGWPRATMCRHEILLRELPDTDYVFLCDADMKFVAPVGKEILPPWGGMVATQHPGYVGMPYAQLPYEQNPESACFIPEGEGHTYYCGGFFGGTQKAMRRYLAETALCMELDMMRRHVPAWHDESAHNRVLATHPPDLVLDPGYCFPEDSEYYEKHVWKQTYEPRLVARVKTPEQREAGRV